MNKVKNRVFREDLADMETCELCFEKGIVIISSRSCFGGSSCPVAAICVVQCPCTEAGCLCSVAALTEVGNQQLGCVKLPGISLL